MQFESYRETLSSFVRTAEKIREFAEGKEREAGQPASGALPSLILPKMAKAGEVPAMENFGALHLLCGLSRSVGANQGAWNLQFASVAGRLGELLPGLLEALHTDRGRRDKAKKQLVTVKKRLKEATRLSSKRQRRWNASALEAMHALVAGHQGLEKKALLRAGIKDGQLSKLTATLKNAEHLNRKAGRGLRKLVSNWMLNQRGINHQIFRAVKQLVDIHSRLRTSLVRQQHDASQSSAKAVHAWLDQVLNHKLQLMDKKLQRVEKKNDEVRERFTTRFLQEVRSESPLTLPPGLLAECSSTADHIYGYKGPLAQQGIWFNEPVITMTGPSMRGKWLATNQRIVERFWVMSRMSQVAPGARVMDARCSESTLSLELASSGYHVTAIDKRNYGLSHPNLRSFIADLCSLPFADGHFDAAVFLSTIEHVGPGHYGDETEHEKDIEAMAEAARVLKPGGTLVLTTPYGVGNQSEAHRIYDACGLARLLQPFEIVERGFALRRNTFVWERSDDEAEAARQHMTSEGWPGAVALIVAKKK